MTGGWGQLLLLSGLPLLLIGIAAAGSFLQPQVKAWIERFVFKPSVWVLLVGYLIFSLVGHHRLGVIVAASLLGLRILALVWALYGRKLWEARATKRLANQISGTGIVP
jgi:membrane associated rhomboid family serine protease